MPSRSPSSRRPSARLTVCTLEDRTVPYGNVNASFSALTGVLTLTGDLQANNVTLAVTAGHVTITGSAPTPGNTGTTINHKAAASFFEGSQVILSTTKPVHAVVANLKGGGDTLSIDRTADFVVSGGVTVNFADGDSTLNLVTTGKLDVGSLTVTSAKNTLHTRNQDYTVAGGAGSAVAGNAAFTYGSGSADIVLAGVAFHGTLAVTGGSGTETTGSTLTASAVTVGKVVNGAVVGNAVTLKYLDAADTVTFNGSTVGTLTVSGKNPTAKLNGLFVPVVPTARTRDAVAVTTTTAGGAAEIDWTGTNQVGGTVRVSGDTAVLNAGAAKTDALAVSGNVWVTAKAKDATLIADKDKSGTLTVSDAVPNTNPSLPDKVLPRTVTVTAGGAATVNVQTAGSTTVSGAVAVTGGTAATVTLSPVVPSTVSGALTVAGGDSGVNVTASSTLAVGGALSVTGKAADDKVTLGDTAGRLEVGGALAIKLGDGDNVVNLIGVEVGGATTLTLGAGDDKVAIEFGAIFHQAFTGAFGAGDDSLTVARMTKADPNDPNSAPPPNPVTFQKVVNMNFGAGNDQMALGLDDKTHGGVATSYVLFDTSAISTFTGGSAVKEVNTFDNTTSDYSYNYPVRLVGWQKLV